MLRSYIFANALRVRKEMDFLPSTEDMFIKKIPLSVWVPLVNQYTKKDYPRYTIEGLLEDYVAGEIIYNPPYPSPINVNYGEVGVYNWQGIIKLHSFKEIKEWKKTLTVETTDIKFISPLLKDDVVYERASVWFNCFKGQLTSIETLFHSGSRAKRFSSTNPNLVKSFSYVVAVFNRFAFEELGVEETYRIMLKVDGRRHTCLEDAGMERKEIPDGTHEKVELGDDFVMFRRFRKDFEKERWDLIAKEEFESG